MVKTCGNGSRENPYRHCQHLKVAAIKEQKLLKIGDWYISKRGNLMRWCRTGGRSAANVDRCREKSKAYRKANRAKIVEYRIANRRYLLTYQAEWRVANKENRKAYGVQYYAKHKEKLSLNRRKHHDKYKEYQRKHYYKKRGTKPGDYRLKKYEEAAINHIQKVFPNAELQLGKSVGNDCTETGTHRYPDVVLTLTSFVIIVEIDENAHRGAAYDCDWRRMNEIAASLGTACYFIRYKPDSEDSDLNVLAERISKVADTDPKSIEWYYDQFYAEYLFYNDNDARKVARRKVFAEQN